MRESNTSTYPEEYGTQKAKVERKIGKSFWNVVNTEKIFEGIKTS
jgi:hypothetical protein